MHAVHWRGLETCRKNGVNRAISLHVCSSINLGCMKFPMAPELTMAVDLIEPDSVTGTVRCLTR